MPYLATAEKAIVEVVEEIPPPPPKPIPWTLIGMIIMGTTMIASSTYVR